MSRRHLKSRVSIRSALQIETLESRTVMSATPVAAIPLDDPTDTAVTPASTPAQDEFDPTSLAALLSTEDWVRSLTGAQLGSVLPQDVRLITASQLQAVPNESYFRSWSAEARAALQPWQVQSLNISAVGISALSAQQVGWLTQQQVQQVKWDQFQLLPPAQVQYLTGAQLQSLTNLSYFRVWSAGARAALQPAQVQALNIAALGIAELTSQQVSWLSQSQVQQVKWEQFQLLWPGQIQFLTAAQVQAVPNVSYFRAWSPAARAALQPAQVQALNVSALGIGELTSQQVSWLSRSQVQQVRWDQFQLLWPGQIQYLTAAQLQTLTNPSFFRVWSAEARAALQPVQVQALNINALGIQQLTLQQTAWLTATQVQQVKWYEFQLLSPQRTPYLSTAQLQSLTNVSFFRSWSPEARAALQAWQVQSLNISMLEISGLTPTQISWLTAAQVAQIKRTDELKLLPPSQVPSLTLGQISSLEAMHFYDWTAASRAALRQNQVPSLNVSSFGIMLLTPEQRAWLTTSQVQQVRWQEFEYLNESQTPFLTLDQVGSLHDMGRFRNWSPAARAALTYSQVRSLDVATLRLEGLTATQIGWLTAMQVQSLDYRDIPGLQAQQIPQLSLAQIRAIPSGAFLADLSEPLQRALTREQLLALAPAVWAQFNVDVLPPANYDPAANNAVGPDGLPNGVHAVEEAAKAFALVPLNAATHATVASGNWSDARIWKDGKVPGAGARVVVSAGTVVSFDAFQTAALKTLRIDGTLSFAADRNTQLKADTVVVYSTGKLFIGTAERPIQDNVTARILIADNGAIDRTWDPYMLSRGIISRGEVKMYGRTVTSYVAATTDLMMGATKITLSSTPTGWRVGDKIVITGVDEMMMNAGAEERTILAINGSVITIDALRLDHAAPQEEAGFIHVANLTRNIELKAEDDSVIAERPHLMFMHNANVALSNVGVYGFGRTDKSQPINDPVVVNGVLMPGTGTNPRARYAIHFHHTGVNPDNAPAQVSGSLVVGSAGWGYVNHSSNVNFDGNVAYQVHGASFASEDGNEIGAMRGNLSISSIGTYGDIHPRDLNHDFGYNGHGFWLQGPGVVMENNISAGSRGAAFMLFMSSSKNLFDAANLSDPALAGGRDAVPVGSVPIKRFYGNVAYASKTGLEIWRHMQAMNDGSGIIDSFLSWNTSLVGIDIHYSGRLKIRNAKLFGDTQGYTAAVGINTNFLTQGITIEEGAIVGFETGIKAPVRRDTTIVRGYISAIVGIDIEKGEAANRTVNVNGTMIVTPASAAWGDRTPMDVYLHAPYDFAPRPARALESLYSEDVITYAPWPGGRYQLYYDEQAPTFVPFKPTNALGYVAGMYLGLTNQQLQSIFGIKLRGGMTPPNAVVLEGVSGGMGVAR